MKLPPLHSPAPHFGRRPSKPRGLPDWLRIACALALFALGALGAAYSLTLFHPGTMRSEDFPLAFVVPLAALVALAGGLGLLRKSRRSR